MVLNFFIYKYYYTFVVYIQYTKRILHLKLKTCEFVHAYTIKFKIFYLSCIYP